MYLPCIKLYVMSFKIRKCVFGIFVFHSPLAAVICHKNAILGNISRINIFHVEIVVKKLYAVKELCARSSAPCFVNASAPFILCLLYVVYC